MSFSSDIKKELCSLENIQPCCYHAQVYGLVLFAHFNKFNLSITTENKDVFDLYLKSMTDYVGFKPVTDTSRIKKLTAEITDASQKEKCFDKFGHSINETSLRINYANIQNECCVASFLRGVFLSCGFVSDPNRNYHLEFVVPYKRLCNDLMKIINELDLEPKYVMRKGNHIVYFKDSESIEDFLAYIGAQNASLYIMSVKIEKDIKLVKEIYIDRATFKNLESEVDQIKEHLKQTDKKIEECKILSSYFKYLNFI